MESSFLKLNLCNVKDGLTGQDWNFALNSGNRAESHIRLKGEQDWDTAGEVFKICIREFLLWFLIF